MSDSDIFLFSANIEEDICISVSRPTPDSSVADAGKFTSVMSEFAQAGKQNVSFLVFNLFSKSFFHARFGTASHCRDSEKLYGCSADTGALTPLSAFCI
ncbi:MAG: hypothetical protein PHE09_06950 [Oscillospiraceae bacterium]|nr:hypothetical protein [Oscillospiraceae bacterium]